MVDFYRAALYAVHAVVVYLSVRLCVCVSVTLRYCVKTAKRRITQIMPYNRDILVAEFLLTKRVARSLCHSRATCIRYSGIRGAIIFCIYKVLSHSVSERHSDKSVSYTHLTLPTIYSV